MKKFYVMNNVGRCKYLLNFHDGISTHKDGSEFFDIRTFKNKVLLNKFIDGLIKDGYVRA